MKNILTITALILSIATSNASSIVTYQLNPTMQMICVKSESDGSENKSESDGSENKSESDGSESKSKCHISKKS